MASILIYIGIALIIIGWLSLSFFAAKQIKAQREYERLPQKREEVKQAFIYKRWLWRGIIILGLIVLIVSLLL